MRRLRILLGLIGVLVIAGAVDGFCEQPLTNEQIVITAVKQAIAEKIQGDMSAAIQVAAKSGELDKLMGSAILDGLAGKFRQGQYLSELDSSKFNVNYSLSGFEFTYKKGKSRGFLKSNRIARDFRCQLRVSISSMTTGLMKSDDISVTYHDEIEPADLNYVKSREIPELAPAAPGSRWSKYTEPFLVVASVGTLVYLFFSNR